MHIYMYCDKKVSPNAILRRRQREERCQAQLNMLHTPFISLHTTLPPPSRNHLEFASAIKIVTTPRSNCCCSAVWHLVRLFCSNTCT